MSRDRLPPPGPAECLYRPYPSSQKGGTLLVEEVTEAAAHHKRLCDPDGYRPDCCPRCGHGVLHVHGYRERRVLGEDEQWVVRIVIHRCAHLLCRATWRILPLFLARRLWRTWGTVEQQIMEDAAVAGRAAVPGRTLRRWKQRLRSSARQAVQVLASSGGALWTRVVEQVGLAGTRKELVQTMAAQQGTAVGSRLASTAALLHRLGLGHNFGHRGDQGRG